MRYSPHPIEFYDRQVDGRLRGPSSIAAFSGDLEAWNLAFISFGYERQPVCPVAEFPLFVARTLRTDLTTAITHPVGAVVPRQLTIRPLLRLPPREFADALLHHTNARRLPLYAGLGENWLSTVFERSWLGGEVADDGLEEEASGLEMQRLIQRCRGVKAP